MQSLLQIVMGDFIIKYTLTPNNTKYLTFFFFYLKQDIHTNIIIRGKESPDSSRAALEKGKTCTKPLVRC